MILYVNGDSHTAAAEAMNPHGFACDDSQYFYMGQAPHPDNLAVSWGRVLADNLKAVLHCHAQAGCSNDRIIRTTQEWLCKFEEQKNQWLMIIQWSTWEREEWLHEGTYYQVGASGIDSVPDALQQRYKEFVVNIDWKEKTQQMHDKIWALHEELDWHQIPHVFFNGNNHFESIQNRRDWGVNYLSPYDPEGTYDAVLSRNGFQTVAPNSWHYGKDAHRFWSRYMLQYIIDNKLVP